MKTRKATPVSSNPDRRYWLGATGLVLLLLILAGFVAVRGTTVGLDVTVSPAPGAVVSGRSRVVLTFPAAMQPASVESLLTVAPEGGGAAVPGSWSWEEGGRRSERVAQFIPAAPLGSGTTYRVTLRSGARAMSGRAVTRDASWSFSVRSPSLLFLRAVPDGQTAQLWGADANGGDLRQITREPGGVLEFSPAPDGSRIAYTTREPPQTTALWIIRADGSGRTRLSPAGDPSGYASPAWSPTGDVIAYVLRVYVPPSGLQGATPPLDGGTNGAAALGNPKIWAVTPDGRAIGRIYGRGDEVGTAPTWSPDGTRLALREQVDERHTSVVLSDLSPTPVKVAAGPGSRIAWSPDGQVAAYDETLPGADGTVRGTITIVRADGTEPRPLFGQGAGAEASPDWSPDGARLAFTRRARGADGASVAEVWTTTRDGEETRRLFGGDGLTALEPTWSPDGRTLVATRFNPRTGEDRGLWRVGADGTGGDSSCRGANVPCGYHESKHTHRKPTRLANRDDKARITVESGAVPAWWLRDARSNRERSGASAPRHAS